MELDTASRQQSPRCDGHMLEKGLIGRRAPFEEAVGVYGLDTLRTSVVVFDFVIVPSNDKRQLRVRFGKVRIAPVKRIAGTIFGERHRIGSPDGAHVRSFAKGLFVDVIPDMNDGVRRVRDHVAIGGEPALFPMLARCQSEAQRLWVGRYGCASAHPARRSLTMKTVKIGPAGQEMIEFDMD